MSVTQFYIEKCRTKLSLELGKEATDYALCKKLGISTSAMSRYTKHGREADDQTAIKIAQYAQIPVFKILAEIHTQTAETPQEKGIWERLLNSPIVKANSKDCILCSIQPVFDFMRNCVNKTAYPVNNPTYQYNNRIFIAGILA